MLYGDDDNAKGVRKGPRVSACNILIGVAVAFTLLVCLFVLWISGWSLHILRTQDVCPSSTTVLSTNEIAAAVAAALSTPTGTSAAQQPSAGCSVIPPAGNKIDVDVLIQGAGIAGLYTAYRLVKNLNVPANKIAIVDKASRLGGRIFDVCLDGNSQLDQNNASNPLRECLGNGPLRVNDAHPFMRGLAAELGVKLEWAYRPWKYQEARGGFVNSIRPGTGVFYRNVTVPPESVCARSDDPLLFQSADWGFDSNALNFSNIASLGMRFDGFDALFWFIRQSGGDFARLLGFPNLCPVNTSIDPKNYPDFKSYSLAAIGNEADAFLRDWLRFRSLSSSNYDANNLLDFVREELLVSGDGDFYPVGGWSAYVRAMASYLRNAGVKFHLGEEVMCMSKGSASTQFLPVVATSGGKFFSAKKIFNSIPPLNMTDISGSLMDELRARPEFRSIEAVKTITISVWWNRRWWEPMREARWPLNKIYFVTYFGGECFNTFETYTTEYLYNQNATRAVYDDGQCVLMWEKLIREGPAGVEKIKKMLVESINRFVTSAGFGDQVQISLADIRDVKPLIRFPAWHLTKPDTEPTVCDIEAWAVNPVPGQPLHLIGEAYGLQLAAWNEGVGKSVLRALRHAYPTPAANGTINSLLSASVCGSNEYATVLADENDPHSAHVSIPIIQAFTNDQLKKNESKFFQGMWHKWGARCGDKGQPGNDWELAEWYQYWPSSCGRLTSADPCHHSDLYSSWVPDYATPIMSFPWVPYGSDPVCPPVVPASFAATAGSSPSAQNLDKLGGSSGAF